MTELHTIGPDDKPWIDRQCAAENSRSADFNYASMYVWDGRYRQHVAELGGRMLVRLGYGEGAMFAFPIGTGELAPVIGAMREIADAERQPLVIRGVTEENRLLLERELPGLFSFTEDSARFDYLYLAEKLATYSGKALHGKKNHCNRFEAENDWRFVPLTPELIPACTEMLSQWRLDNAERLDASVAYEQDALLKSLEHYDELGFEGGVLFTGDTILGFSFGVMTSDDTFDVLFEKAVISVRGAYPMVCRELTRMVLRLHPEVLYMNREDDLGLEALRESKLSYKPEFLLKKYTATIKED